MRASPRKEFGPCRPKPGDPLVGPALILRRKARLAFLIVPDSAPVPAVDVDLLECGLDVKCRGLPQLAESSIAAAAAGACADKARNDSAMAIG